VHPPSIQKFGIWEIRGVQVKSLSKPEIIKSQIMEVMWHVDIT
jgi:hypothetical protein